VNRRADEQTTARPYSSDHRPGHRCGRSGLCSTGVLRKVSGTTVTLARCARGGALSDIRRVSQRSGCPFVRWLGDQVRSRTSVSGRLLSALQQLGPAVSLRHPVGKRSSPSSLRDLSSLQLRRLKCQFRTAHCEPRQVRRCARVEGSSINAGLISLGALPGMTLKRIRPLLAGNWSGAARQSPAKRRDCADGLRS